MEIRPSRAVIIGIDGEGPTALDGAAREAESFAAFLGLRDIVKEPVRVITDIDKGKGKLPTRDTILEALRWLCGSRDEGSCGLLVYIGSRSKTHRGLRPLDWEDSGDIEEAELVKIFREATNPVLTIFDTTPASQILTLPHCMPATYSSSDSRGEDFRILHLSSVQTGEPSEEEEPSKGGVLVSGLLTVLRAHGSKHPTYGGLLAAIRILIADGRWKRAPTLSSCNPIDPSSVYNFTFHEDANLQPQPMETNPTPLAPPPAPPLQGRPSVNNGWKTLGCERSRSGSCETAPQMDGPVKSSPVQRKSRGSSSSRCPSSSMDSAERDIVKGLEFSPQDDLEVADAHVRSSVPPEALEGWGSRVRSVTPPPAVFQVQSKVPLGQRAARGRPPPAEDKKEAPKKRAPTPRGVPRRGTSVPPKQQQVQEAPVEKPEKPPAKKVAAPRAAEVAQKTRRKVVENAAFTHPVTCLLQDTLSPLATLGPAMNEVYGEILDWVEKHAETCPPGEKLAELLKRRRMEEEEFSGMVDERVRAVLGSSPGGVNFMKEMLGKVPGVKGSWAVVGTKDAGKSTFLRAAAGEVIVPYMKEYKRFTTKLLTVTNLEKLYPKEHEYVNQKSFYAHLISGIFTSHVSDLLLHRPILRQWQAQIHLFWKRVATGVPTLPKQFQEAFPNISTVWQREAVVIHTQYAAGAFSELLAHAIQLPLTAFMTCCGFDSWFAVLDGLNRVLEDHEAPLLKTIADISTSPNCHLATALPATVAKKVPGSIHSIPMTNMVPTSSLPPNTPTVIRCEGKVFTPAVFGGCPGYLTSFLSMIGKEEEESDDEGESNPYGKSEREIEFYSPSILKLLTNLEILHCKQQNGQNRRV